MKNNSFLEKPVSDRGARILQLLQEKENNSAIRLSASYFANVMNCSVSTINRELKELRERGLIIYEHQRFRVADEVSEEEILSAEDANNLALIAAVKGLLLQYKNTPLFEEAERLIYKLTANSARKGGLMFSGRVAVPPQIEYNVNQTSWKKIFLAISRNLKISFRYKGIYDPNKLRIFCPYQILLDNGDVYVYGYSETNKMNQLYMLCRMYDITVKTENFDLPQDYEFVTQVGGGRLGAYKGFEVETFKIEFRNYTRAWIQEHKLADDQTFVDDDKNDKTIITFSSNQRGKILRKLLEFGHNVKPLEPESFANEWKTEIQKMMAVALE